jgi:cytochrome c oxidase subunit 2
MFAEIIWFPHQATTTATAVDHFLIFLVVVTGLVGLLVAVLLIGFAIRYRRRPGDGRPPFVPANRQLELFWTLSPLGIFLIMFVWGAILYFDAYRAPDNATVVYVVAKQWMWKFQHPEGQREINHLHVPIGQPVKLLLTSEDVIHCFYVPDFRVHMDVVPGRYGSVWFQATRPGEYHLFCSQYCGTNHSGMVGTVHVMTQDDYQEWLHLNAEGSLALQGRKTFLKYRCVSCHSADEHARAPVLEELYGKTVHYRLRNESGAQRNDWHTTTADDDYIRQSIWDPGAKIVAGYENIMPTFKDQVSAEEINELIAFIRSLKRGETPRRVEEYPPPIHTPPINSKK